MKNHLIGSTAIAGLAILLAGCAGGTDTATEPPAAGTEAPLFDALPEAIQEAGVIRVAADPHPPYRTMQPGGEITGIDPDFWAMVSEPLGVQIEFEEASAMPAILTGIEAGRYDAYNGPLGASAEREEQFDMIGWMKNDVSYLYSKELNEDFEDIEDMCGINIGFGVGSIVEKAIVLLSDWCEEQGLPRSTGVGLKDTSATMVALQSDQVQAAGMTEAAALDIVNADDTFGYVIQTEEQGTQTVISSVLVKRGSGLGEPLYQALKAVFEDGSYEEFMAKWELEAITIPEPLLNPTTGRPAE